MIELREMFKGIVNSPETTTTNNISATDTLIYVLDNSIVPTDLPNILTLGSGRTAETVKVISANDQVLTVERGFQGVARAWNSGTTIARNFTEYDFDTLRYNIDVTASFTGELVEAFVYELSQITDSLGEKVSKEDIIDTLTSNDGTKVLSAKQGKVLNDALALLRTDLGSQELNKGASLIAINDKDNKFVATSVEGALLELFTNVSSGKELIGGAITDKDSTIILPSDPTFSQLAEGIGKITTGIDTSPGTMIAADLLAGKIGYSKGAKITGTMVDRGTVASTITSQNGEYTVPAGKHSGAGKIKASFANLIASNVKKGINIGGIVGSFAGDGKKHAGGIITINSSDRIYDFIDMDDGYYKFSRHGILVSGLTFKPSVIVISDAEDTGIHRGAVSYNVNNPKYSVSYVEFEQIFVQYNYFAVVRLVPPAYINSTGFLFPFWEDDMRGTRKVRWDAYE